MRKLSFLDPRRASARQTLTPRYGDMADRVEAICHMPSTGGDEWYPLVLAGARTLAEGILSTATVEKARDVLRRLSPDDYSAYLVGFYEAGLDRLGATWKYADIVTTLIVLAARLKPRRYLEIGVRRGRSACAVASQAPECDLSLFDMWIAGYAGMENPGPDLVRSELAKVGHRGACEFIDGNSHETLPRYFAANPGVSFDLITVDGDHSDMGAAQDLCDVLPHLAIGGAVVFDDIVHPLHPGLRDVWRDLVVNDPRFSAWSFEDVGYGVGFAIRKS